MAVYCSISRKVKHRNCSALARGDFSVHDLSQILKPCGFSPASAGLENATAGSKASRSTVGALQRSLRSLLRLRLRCPACLANRLAALRAVWRFSPAPASLENATAVAVSRNGLKSCGSHMGLSAICSANRDKSPSEASRSTESALSQRACELRNVPKRRKSAHRKYGGTA